MYTKETELIITNNQNHSQVKPLMLFVSRSCFAIRHRIVKNINKRKRIHTGRILTSVIGSYEQFIFFVMALETLFQFNVASLA